MTPSCQMEFNLTGLHEYLDDVLPECNQLPSSTLGNFQHMIQGILACKTHGCPYIMLFYFCLIAAESGSENDELLLNEFNLTCSSDFYLENSTCVPSCSQWKPYLDVEYAILWASLILTTVLAVVGSTGVIIGAIIRRKSM